MNNSSFRMVVEDVSQVAEARRLVSGLAEELKFSEKQRSDLAIIVTELGTNLIKHGGGGELLYRGISANSFTGIETLALDRGAGSADIDRYIADGFSTSGTAGNGLGAIRRLSSSFDIFSMPGAGTAVLSRISSNGTGSANSVGAVSVPLKSEVVCGDAWEIIVNRNRVVAIVADGLGHGPEANRASDEAVRVFTEQQNYSPTHILDSVCDALRATRGAAVAIAEIDLEKNVVNYTGLGNISTAILAPGTPSRSLVSMNGTAGQSDQRSKEFTYPWERTSRLIMHSDGLKTRWDINQYPGLLTHDPGLIAGVLYRDFERGSDDASIVVVDSRALDE